MEELKQQLIELINNKSSLLPAEAIYYVVKDFYRDIEDSYSDYLRRKKIQDNEENTSKTKENES